MMNDFYSYKTKILAGKKLNIAPKLKKQPSSHCCICSDISKIKLQII